MAEVKRGAWSPEEDRKLISYIRNHGIWNWSQIPKFAGLARTGKSCRLRWVNYLRPDVKRGPFSREEVEIIIKMYQSMGNRWSAMAAQLPGRSDNEIKNFFHTHLKKHLRQQAKHAAPAADHRSKDDNTTSDDANKIIIADDCNLLGSSSSSVVILESSRSCSSSTSSRVENNNDASSGGNNGTAAAFSSDTVMDMRMMERWSCLDYDDVNAAFWYDVLIEAEYLKF